MRAGRGAHILFLSALAAAVLPPFPRAALAQEDKAAKVKSVFLFKFFDYVTWPAGRAPGAGGGAVLCTYGPHGFGDLLEYIAQRKSGPLRFRVRAITGMEASAGCHILYVAPGRYGDIPAAGAGVLTVGDGDGFLPSGGVIQMKEDGGKVRLIIDLGNAARGGLRISSRLLDIAEVRK